MTTNKAEKIQKVLANAGAGSRRQIEQWITAGRIMVNGHRAEIGERITTDARVEIDSKPVILKPRIADAVRVLVYHKPAGEICTRLDDQKQRPTVYTHLPNINSGRWVSIGRLDVSTSGLLLFSNDGELAHQLMHPRQGVEREYAVRIYGEVPTARLREMLDGIMLEDGLARFEKIVIGGGEGMNHWYHVVLVSGRNRLVRRMWEAQGVSVSRLIRVRYGPIALPRSLPAGRWLELPQNRVQQLKDLCRAHTGD